MRRTYLTRKKARKAMFTVQPSKYFPGEFAVVGDNGEERGSFEDAARAQRRADILNQPDDGGDAIFQSLITASGAYGPPERESEPPVVVPKANEIIIPGKNEVGSLIEYKGAQWLVTACEEPAHDADMEDDLDIPSLGYGLHSWLVKVQSGNKALEVVALLLKSGEATLTGPSTLLFKDEQYASLLSDLAYSAELGVYDRTKITP